MNRAERRRRTMVKLLERVRILKMEASWHDGEIRKVPGRSKRMRELIGHRGHSSVIGRCRSTHPFDCGRPRCGLCSEYRRYGRKDTIQEKKVTLKQKETLDECNAPL